jgi:hypothetical protein
MRCDTSSGTMARMDLDTLRRLRAVDAANPGCLEYPDGFNWPDELAQVRALAPIVERITGRTFQVDTQVQDASFLTDLATYDVVQRPGRHTELIAVLAVRFSTFGRLFTIWWSTATPLDPVVVTQVIDAVGERGYVYIDNDALGAAYTGIEPRLEGTSWRIRFFDYL